MRWPRRSTPAAAAVQDTEQKISLSLRDGDWLVHVLRHQTSTEHYHASLVGRRVPCNARRAGAP